MSIIQGTAHSGGQYQIERSLRFNSADSAYLSRTPASAGTDRTKWTFSVWIKRSALGSVETIFSAGTTSNDYSWLRFDSDNTLSIFNATSGVTRCSLNTLAVFRDVSAYYHIVFNRNGSSGAKIYVNGIEQSVTGTNYSGTTNDFFADSVAGSIGRLQRTGTLYLNGYLTEINFIDGQALTPSSFGETDSATGVWKPKRYTGTYGTNGFFLKFADNSGTTSTTLGKDSSGNGNNWTPNNFSVTAGAGNDSLVDVPTLWGSDTGAGGEVRGNYATLSAIDKVGSGTLTNGNLDYATSSGTYDPIRGTLGVSSGKWYWEVTCTAQSGASANTFMIGIASQSTNINASNWYVGTDSASYGYYAANGNKYNNASGSAYGATYTTNDVIGVALDLDAGTLVFYKNNVSQGTAYSSLSGTFMPAYSDAATAGATSVTFNFGQRPFAYTAPSGFKALCTQNLPTPTIGATSTTQANDYFNAVTYTGTGATQSITGLDFQPDFVWIKSRNNAGANHLIDAVRGVPLFLFSDATSAESSRPNSFTSFNSNGFTVGSSSDGNTNLNTYTYVAWNWKANGAGSTNTSGTITSTVSANTTSGFSIVTYTGTGANATVGHGLGVAPRMIIVKSRDQSPSDWQVYHTSLGNTAYISLNLTNASATAAAAWNNTSPTSTVFSIGTAGSINASTKTFVAYCFAEVAGYSKFGSYTGNGSADGPFVYLGFRPRYVMIKYSSGVDSWFIFDSAREPENVMDLRLEANTSNSEASVTNGVDFLSNGFKVRSSNAAFNANTGTYIYAAFAETPAKFSLAR